MFLKRGLCRNRKARLMKTIPGRNLTAVSEQGRVGANDLPATEMVTRAYIYRGNIPVPWAKDWVLPEHGLIVLSRVLSIGKIKYTPTKAVVPRGGNILSTQSYSRVRGLQYSILANR